MYVALVETVELHKNDLLGSLLDKKGLNFTIGFSSCSWIWIINHSDDGGDIVNA